MIFMFSGTLFVISGLLMVAAGHDALAILFFLVAMLNFYASERLLRQEEEHDETRRASE